MLAALISGTPGDARAQEGGDGHPLRIILSPGLVLAGGTELESGIGGLAQLAVERGRHRGAIRIAVVADVSGFPDGSGDGDVSETGLLYGRRGGTSGPGWSLSAGLAAVHFERCPEETADPLSDPGCTTLGVPVVAEAGIGAPVVGLALQLFGNLNLQAPYAGLGLSLPLGWMR